MEQSLKGKNLIQPTDFLIPEIDALIEIAIKISNKLPSYRKVAEGKLLATLFFEPSTRTRLSFEAAMLRLGGKVLGFSESASSSTAKGESLSDTIKTVSKYVDAIVIRHPKEGSAFIASQSAEVPVINAGDGGHYHPTQTLTDLLTIKKEKGRLDNLRIGCCGDLKFGRTVHSLVKAMGHRKNNEFVFISPNELRIPEYVRTDLEKTKSVFAEVTDLNLFIKDLDVLYMTRVQRERFFNEEEYLKLKDIYILDEKKMELADKDLIVLHPLPRVNEIEVGVDKDSRAKYFDQAQNGMYIRMALLKEMLGV